MITEHSIDDLLLEFNSVNLLQGITAFEHALHAIKETDIKKDLWKINQDCAATIEALYHSPNSLSTAAMIPLFWSNFENMTKYAHISGIETRVMRARIMFLTLRAHIWVKHIAEDSITPNGPVWASGLLKKISNTLNRPLLDPSRVLLLDSKLYLPKLPSTVYQPTLPRFSLNVEETQETAIRLTAQTIRSWLGFPPGTKTIIQCSLLETLLSCNMTAILHLDIVWFMYLDPLSHIMQGVQSSLRQSNKYIKQILDLFYTRFHQHPIVTAGSPENMELCYLQGLVDRWTQEPFDAPVQVTKPTMKQVRKKMSQGEVQDSSVSFNPDSLI
jgi:hypothetical protein